MSQHSDDLKLDKGMYSVAGKSFTAVLESEDPSERYKGTALEGLDAYQRQLKRFGIKVKGSGSDVVDKFFQSAQSAVLFPEYISRTVRQGMEEADLLPAITATVTSIDGMDYRSITSVPEKSKKELKRVEEGAEIPQTTIKTQENLVKLHKRGRMLVAPYEAVRYQKLDLFSVASWGSTSAASCWRTPSTCWRAATATTTPPRPSPWALPPSAAPPASWRTATWWTSGPSLTPMR